MEFSTYKRVRDKETGRIGIIKCISYGSYEDKNGNVHNMKIIVSYIDEKNNITEVDYFDDNFSSLETIDHDFTSIIPSIMNFLKTDLRVAGIPEIIARRLDPDYFSIGSLVFFTNEDWIDKDYRYGQYYGGRFSYGPEYPYIIVDCYEIKNNDQSFINENNCDIKFELCLKRNNDTLKTKLESGAVTIKELANNEFGGNGFIIVPMSLTKFSRGDAYSILSRYDKEY